MPLVKPPEFFIAKANEYASVIDEINKHFISRLQRLLEQTPEMEKQSVQIQDIRLNIRLMFSEFDNGDLFTQELDRIDNNPDYIFKENDLLEAYKKVLRLFASHISEYRC